jgi:hypothetical protein
MRKQMVALLAGAMLMMATSAMALSINTSGQLVSGSQTFNDIGAELVSLIDTDGDTDTVGSFLYLEISAGFAPNNLFGIYNPLNTNEKLELFPGPASGVYNGDFADSSVNILFDLVNGTAKNLTTNVVSNVGSQFGFYLDSSYYTGGGLFYSQTDLNTDGVDHFKIYNTLLGTGFLSANVVVAAEDLFGGGDFDYNDMIAGATDVTPVPEPGTVMLLGMGLLGMAVYGKRRMNKNV